jgi:hypothetical protein
MGDRCDDGTDLGLDLDSQGHFHAALTRYPGGHSELASRPGMRRDDLM